MNKYKVLKKIIEALMEFAIPSMTPDDFTELEKLTNKLSEHYNK